MGGPGVGGGFGVVVMATPEHLHWVRGTCASVRHFMGDTPICILLDGDRGAADAGDAYDGVQVLRVDDVEPKELRLASRRSTRAKSTALWAAPFETYLVVDCDTVVWGDVRRLADFDRADFVVNASGREALSDVMDVEAVRRLFPGFDAASHVGDYVNAGVYFARRGMLDLDRYLEAVEIQQRHPGVLMHGDQGVFNLMVFWAADEGTIRLDQRELQIVVKDATPEEVAGRFGFRGGRPAVVGEPVVIHWAGGGPDVKPRVRERCGQHFAPMTYFRLQYLRDRRGASATDRLRLRVEDMTSADIRSAGPRGALKRARRSARLRWARVKIPIRRRIPDRVLAMVRRRPEAGGAEARGSGVGHG